MTFQIYNYFNVYLLKILLIYTELEKQKNKKTKQNKVESKRNKYIEKKILTQVHPISKKKKSKISTTQIRYMHTHYMS